ncbi:MAG: GTP-binding protein Era [Candidatus Deianiraeaceae bacterium]|jgi:GTP-binding protein Era
MAEQQPCMKYVDNQEVTEESVKKLFLEIAICGVPNAGKSSFLNAFLQKKSSIVSNKPQTTRVPTIGVFENDDITIQFTDSPGAFKARKGYSLEKIIAKQAWTVLGRSENVMLFIDGSREICQNTEYLFQSLERDKKNNVIAVITKADFASAKQKLELATTLSKRNIFDDIYMISSKTGAGMQNLMNYFKKISTLEEVEQGSEVIQDKETFSSEITREVIFDSLYRELPYSCNVVTTSFEENDKKIDIRQDILVTRESHKIILVGKRGLQIKEIGASSIDEMEKHFNKTVHLSLECRIDAKWRENFTLEVELM